MFPRNLPRSDSKRSKAGRGLVPCSCYRELRRERTGRWRESLTAVMGKEPFYEKLGFAARPAGMGRYMEIE